MNDPSMESYYVLVYMFTFLLTSSFSPFSCITSISHNFWITHSFQMNDPSLESYDVLLYMCNKNLDLALFFLLTSAFFPSNLQKIVCVTSIDVMWRHNQWLSKNYRNVFRVYWYMSWPSFVAIEAFFAWLINETGAYKPTFLLIIALSAFPWFIWLLVKWL